MTRVDSEVWRKELKDHAELYEKRKARTPKDLPPRSLPRRVAAGVAVQLDRVRER